MIFSIQVVGAQPCTPLQERLNGMMQAIDGAMLVVRADTGRELAAVHRELFYDTRQPAGSLVKPFAAVAYYSDHTTQAFPVFRCPATLVDDPAGCWDRAGHGEVDLRRAIAFSCNVYFRQLAARIAPATFARVLSRFGLPLDPGAEASVAIMDGESSAWRAPPHLLLRGYAALFNHGYLWASGEAPAGQAPLPRPIVELLREGMIEGARRGTSELARIHSGNRPVMGKTGTSVLLVGDVADHKNTQAWWIGLYPAREPEIAVMAFVRKGRGSLDAAPLGGKAIAAYAESGCK